MKRYDFERVINRRNTDSVKADALEEHFGRKDLLPLWVADMDFATPDFIIRAMKKRLRHPVLGYNIAPDSYWQSIIAWESELHDWKIDREELTFVPGIVRGIAMALECLTQPKDKVVIQPPVYHPFRIIPENMGREVVRNPLRQVDGGYEFDLEQLDSLCRQEKPKVLILSNPHNPGGVVWSADSLAALAQVCAANGVIVISDEIHADMTFPGYVHTPFCKSCETARRISVTFAAPSKTFNMPGITSSFAVVPDRDLRGKFFGFLSAFEFNSPSIMSAVATEAAFCKGKQWRLQMLDYVRANIDFMEEYLRLYIPGIKFMRPGASFLVWLDCRGLGLDHDALVDLFVNKAKLALNDGAMFGEEGSGYMRLNVATPRRTLEKAMDLLHKAVARLN